MSQPIRSNGVIISNRFRLERPLGEGGMGVVYLATDLESGESVAIKTLKAPPAKCDAKYQEMLRTEATILTVINNPNVPTVFVTGPGYYVMSFIKNGIPLNEHSRFSSDKSSVRLRPFFEIIGDLCSGLSFAHDKRIIHRDLKPGNMMIAMEKDGPKGYIIDFGLAKQSEVAGFTRIDINQPGHSDLQPARENGLTNPTPVSLLRTGNYISYPDPNRAKFVVGTPAYMSPEMAAGQLEKIGPQTDIYGFGGAAYEALTGQAPNQGSDVFKILLNTRFGVRERLPQEPPRDFNRRQRIVYPYLVKEIQRALELEPQNRHADCREFFEAVEPFAQHFMHRQTQIHGRPAYRHDPAAILKLFKGFARAQSTRFCLRQHAA